MILIRQSPPETSSPWSQAEARQLERGLGMLGQQASASQMRQLRSFGELLLKWNGTYNLLGATLPRALVEEHLLDTLAILPALDRWLHAQPQVLVDVGSGAGLPGIVLAIQRPQLTLVLVEPIGKKAAFLRQAVATCSLANVRVVEGRIEDAESRRDFSPANPGADADGAPHFICRAFTTLERFAELCGPHVCKGPRGSLLFAMKAARVGEELQHLGGSVEVLAVEELLTVQKDVQRNLVVMRPDHGASGLGQTAVDDRSKRL